MNWINNFVYEGQVTRIKPYATEKYKGMMLDVGCIGMSITFFTEPDMVKDIVLNNIVTVTGHMTDRGGSTRLTADKVIIKK